MIVKIYNIGVVDIDINNDNKLCDKYWKEMIRMM